MDKRKACISRYSAIILAHVPVAQLDRASASGAEGCGFDPRPGYHYGRNAPDFRGLFFICDQHQLLTLYFTNAFCLSCGCKSAIISAV